MLIRAVEKLYLTTAACGETIDILMIYWAQCALISPCCSQSVVQAHHLSLSNTMSLLVRCRRRGQLELSHHWLEVNPVSTWHSIPRNVRGVHLLNHPHRSSKSWMRLWAWNAALLHRIDSNNLTLFHSFNRAELFCRSGVVSGKWRLWEWKEYQLWQQDWQYQKHQFEHISDAYLEHL